MEIWKDIEGYPNYQVSDLGRVKSKARITNVGIRHTSQVLRKERILVPRKDSNGYLRVQLFLDKVGKDFVLSRLVAKAFIKEDLSKDDCISYKNKDKTDCSADNLSIIESTKFPITKYYTFYGIKCDAHKLSKMSGIRETTIRRRLGTLKWNVYEATEVPIRILKNMEVKE